MPRSKTFNEEEVLDKAVDLFWTKGYNATSANDLVKHLGLSRSSIYATYTDKRSLFIKALDRYRQRNVHTVIEMVEHSSDIRKTISEIFEHVISQDIHQPIPKGCMMVNSSIELAPHDAGIAAVVKDNECAIEAAFKKAILKGQASGEISSTHSADALAAFFYNTISGLRVSLRARTDETTVRDVIGVALSIL